MSDNLERFIRQNRRDFDQYQPGAELWSKIETTLPPKKNDKRFTLRDIYKWSAAAAIVVILLTSLYFLVIRKDSHDITDSKKTPVQVSPVENIAIAPEDEAAIKEAYHSIGQKQKELQTLTVGQPGLYQQFLEDLKALDSSYQALKVQAQNSPNRDVLIRAMMQNLRLQAELLSRQLTITNQLNNNEKKSSNESSI